ncbi:MAG TPA: potassium-transporting ATPase subunit KdpC [Caulobacteraceae bacterium]|jgi:K+-transporting ATPase ATPase C chain|nr:potassium-transporting ATPase subunit KdpC [Caulobacteraceae bacterium]
MTSDLRPAVVSAILFTILFGLAYPLVVTGIADAVFPTQAQGSLVRGSSGKVVGSALIAQRFSRPQYLHPRPSAAGNGYDATNSGGSNLGPLNPDLAKRIKIAAAQLRADDGHQEIPDDAITTSASGLDPDISPAYALLQVERVAKARGASPEAVRALIWAHVVQPDLGFIGQPRVNVLAVNLALDDRHPMPHP